MNTCAYLLTVFFALNILCSILIVSFSHRSLSAALVAVSGIDTRAKVENDVTVVANGS